MGIFVLLWPANKLRHSTQVGDFFFLTVPIVLGDSSVLWISLVQGVLPCWLLWWHPIRKILRDLDKSFMGTSLIIQVLGPKKMLFIQTLGIQCRQCVEITSLGLHVIQSLEVFLPHLRSHWNTVYADIYADETVLLDFEFVACLWVKCCQFFQACSHWLQAFSNFFRLCYI